MCLLQSARRVSYFWVVSCPLKTRPRQQGYQSYRPPTSNHSHPASHNSFPSICPLWAHLLGSTCTAPSQQTSSRHSFIFGAPQAPGPAYRPGSCSTVGCPRNLAPQPGRPPPTHNDLHNDTLLAPSLSRFGQAELSPLPFLWRWAMGDGPPPGPGEKKSD